MENLANYIFIGSIIAICLLVLRINRRRDDGIVRDPGEALVEFGNAYPKEAIRGALMDKSGKTTFMRLADGKTGLIHMKAGSYSYPTNHVTFKRCAYCCILRVRTFQLFFNHLLCIYYVFHFQTF